MTCVRNPNYSGPGQETDYYDSPYYDTVSGEPCTPGYNPQPGQYPNITITPGGVTGHTNKLDKFLNTLLSGMAIVRGVDHIPTTIPTNTSSGELSPEVLALLLRQNQAGGGGGGNTGAKIENWFKNNTGVALLGGVVIAAYLMKSPRQGR